MNGQAGNMSMQQVGGPFPVVMLQPLDSGCCGADQDCYWRMIIMYAVGVGVGYLMWGRR